MPELLVEVGCEELPARFVDLACAHLRDRVPLALKSARLEHGGVICQGTPRRLVLKIQDLAAKQPDREEEITGPKASIAWGEDGALSKAGAGFLKSRGIDPKDAYKKETKKGEVIAAKFFEAGKTASEVLPAQLAELFLKIPFPKSMRWSDEKNTFGRPIRWVCSVLDDKALPLSIAGVDSKAETYGHRFMAPGPFAVSSAKSHGELLAANHIVLDADERRRLIWEGAKAAAAEVGGFPLEDKGLLDEVAQLVESPWPLLGRFEDRFLEMPRELLLSEMREHQRYFGVVDKAGDLMSAFIVVAGSEPKDAKAVGAGNARVLRSRFEDGAFYFSQDKKRPLESRVLDLKKVVFQRDLGTLHEKVERVEHIAAEIAARISMPSDEARDGLRAAKLCKADLITGVVGEFPDLQGIMGATYAKIDGESAGTCQAIEEHYHPLGGGAALPKSAAGALVAVADRLDTLVGILAVMKAPSGSADPFGLRRASVGILRILIERDWRIGLSELVDVAVDAVGEKSKKPAAELKELALGFIHGRMRAVFSESIPTDLIDAAMDAGAEDLVDLNARLKAMAAMRDKDEKGFVSLAATFKRVANMIKQAKGEGITIPEGVEKSKLVEEPSQKLFDEIGVAKDRFPKINEGESAESRADAYDKCLHTIAELKPSVDNFFDHVMVMTDDAALREARLGLLVPVEQMLATVADFTRLKSK